MTNEQIKAELESKYPGLVITWIYKGDGFVDWLFTSPVRGKAVAVGGHKPGITPSLPPVSKAGSKIIFDFYQAHLAAALDGGLE